jgi:hypothetical protein
VLAIAQRRRKNFRSMKTSLCFLTAILSICATAPRSIASKPAKAAQAAVLAATQFDGTITAISDTSVIVKGATGEKTFAIHQGTVFGQGAKKKLADFKAGDHVLVSFSTAAGQFKAENIRKVSKKPKAAK